LVEKESGRGPQKQNKEITKSDPIFDGAGIGGVFGGDWSAVGCFDLCNLPNSGQKENALLNLVNTVPELSRLFHIITHHIITHKIFWYFPPIFLLYSVKPNFKSQ